MAFCRNFRNGRALLHKAELVPITPTRINDRLDISRLLEGFILNAADLGCIK